MNPEHSEFLKKECNRLTYGKCCIASCLRRGGFKRGTVNIPDFDKATCVPYEIYNELLKK